jgi:hypothetical protein
MSTSQRLLYGQSNRVPYHVRIEKQKIIFLNLMKNGWMEKRLHITNTYGKNLYHKYRLNQLIFFFFWKELMDVEQKEFNSASFVVGDGASRLF